MGAGVKWWGRGCERMGRWGDVGVPESAKDGGRCAKNGAMMQKVGCRAKSVC